MPLVMTEGGLMRLVLRLVGQDVSLSDWSVGLFVNSLTPDLDTVLADFVEPSWPAYGRVDLDPAEWQSPVFVDDRAETVYGTTPLFWANDGSSQTVYGYFVLDNSDDTVLWAERFGTPRVLPPSANLELTLVDYLRNDPSPP